MSGTPQPPVHTCSSPRFPVAEEGPPTPPLRPKSETWKSWITTLRLNSHIQFFSKCHKFYLPRSSETGCFLSHLQTLSLIRLPFGAWVWGSFSTEQLVFFLKHTSSLFHPLFTIFLMSPTAHRLKPRLWKQHTRFSINDPLPLSLGRLLSHLRGR